MKLVIALVPISALARPALPAAALTLSLPTALLTERIEQGALVVPLYISVPINSTASGVTVSVLVT